MFLKPGFVMTNNPVRRLGHWRVFGKGFGSKFGGSELAVAFNSRRDVEKALSLYSAVCDMIALTVKRFSILED
jgi:hypothetical protein